VSSIAAILLDIEGTTTPITFVTRVLFPYARQHLRAYLEQHAGSPDHESLVARLRDEHASASRECDDVPAWAVATFVEWLMEHDSKSTALKDLQGRIWEIGYQRGELVGEVFADVPRALERWHEDGLAVGIFSSGSVLAQQLLFRHSSYGDLTPLIGSYFDTRIGAKADAESYRRIARELELPAHEVLFLSDVVRELDAARAADMQVRLVIRPGNPPVAETHRYEHIESFADVRSILDPSALNLEPGE
jgi:enolase-phosphatase E1